MKPFPTGITLADTLQIVGDIGAARRLPVEAVGLARAHGRVLAHDLIAFIDLPPFDNSAMDGFALRHADLSATHNTRLRLAGEQFAGTATDSPVAAGTCVRITTGAAVPPSVDTVLIKEAVRDEGGHIVVGPGTMAGANIRKAGEDVRAGDVVLRAGDVLTPARVSLAAALGKARLDVATRPTVAVFTTGDELVEPGLPLAPGQIYNSNRELLMGLLRADGLEPTAWPTLPDDPARVAAALRDAAAAFDVVLTCGAVSAGEKDHIPALVSQHGRLHFWKVRMKPGMPVLFGEIDRALLLGLPGNPVSVLATWLVIGRALCDALQGRREPRLERRARLDTAITTSHTRCEFLRGSLHSDDDGTLQVTPHPATGSHRLRAAAQANALIRIPEGPCHLSVGDAVDVIPY